MAKFSVLLILLIVVVAPTWIVFHYVFSRTSRRKTKSVALKRIHLKEAEETITQLETRLQHLESYVTSPEFSLRSEIGRI